MYSSPAAAGLEIDDATAAEVGGFGEALTSRKGARKPRNVAAADDADEGIGENEVTAHLSADDVAAARADAGQEAAAPDGVAEATAVPAAESEAVADCDGDADVRLQAAAEVAPGGDSRPLVQAVHPRVPVDRVL